MLNHHLVKFGLLGVLGFTLASSALVSRADASADSYWNDQLYQQVNTTVTNSTQTLQSFFDHQPVYRVTSQAYRKYITPKKEWYGAGNGYGDNLAAESHTNAATDPKARLIMKHHTVQYYGDAINQAIKDANKAGGGVVELPASSTENKTGIYYSGSIQLLSNVELKVDHGATVKFMRNRSNAYYPMVLTSYEGNDLYNYSPLIYALGQKNIAVTGGGLLDGQEDYWNWRPWKKGYFGEPDVENHSLNNQDYAENGILGNDNFTNVPVTDRVFTDNGAVPKDMLTLSNPTNPVGNGAKQITPPNPAAVMKSAFRPTFIEPNYCQNVLIEGVTLQNAPFWQVHPANSENVMVQNINIQSDKTTGYESRGWNNDDGIDPDASKNVIIQNNHIKVSDDGIAIKAYRNNDGMNRHGPSQNIIIRNNTFDNRDGDSAAISAGSEMSGGIKNIFVTNNTIGGTGIVHGFKLKTNAYRGGYIKNIYIRDVTLNAAKYALIQFDSNYSETVPVANKDLYDPTIKNIYIDHVASANNLEASKGLIDFASAASRAPVSNINIKNTTFYTAKSIANSFTNNKFINDLTLNNVQLINPSTNRVITYNSSPIKLVDKTIAISDSKRTKLTANSATADTPVINHVPDKTFQLTGQIDLSSYPNFIKNGIIKLYLDRDSTPIPVTLNSDGTFKSDPITLNDNQYWYQGQHYVSINFYSGDQINTAVYHVTYQ